MSDNFENANNFILGETTNHSSNAQHFELHTNIFPVIHNTNVPKLNAICRLAKTYKAICLIAIIAICLGLLGIFVFAAFNRSLWCVLSIGVAIVSFVLIFPFSKLSKAEERKLYAYFQDHFVSSELKKYIQIQSFEEPTIVKPFLKLKCEDPSQNSSVITSKPWTLGRIYQNIKGKFHDKDFQFMAIELVSIRSYSSEENEDNINEIMFHRGNHVWNGQFFIFNAEKAFEKDVDIFSLPDIDQNTPLEKRYVIRKHDESSIDNIDFIIDGGNPYKLELMKLKQEHGWTDTALRIYRQNALLKRGSKKTPASGPGISLAEAGCDSPKFRQMLMYLSQVLDEKCFTLRVRQNALILVIESIDAPFMPTTMDTERSAKPFCDKLEKDIKDFVSVLEAINN